MKNTDHIQQTLGAWRNLPPAADIEQVRQWVHQQPPLDLRDRHWLRVFWNYLFSPN